MFDSIMCLCFLIINHYPSFHLTLPTRRQAGVRHSTLGIQTHPHAHAPIWDNGMAIWTRLSINSAFRLRIVTATEPRAYTRWMIFTFSAATQAQSSTINIFIRDKRTPVNPSITPAFRLGAVMAAQRRAYILQTRSTFSSATQARPSIKLDRCTI